VAAAQLPPPARLALWAGVFGRFFPWVWASIVLLLGSGFALVAVLGGFGSVHPGVHIMTALGILMVLIYCLVYFVPFRRLKAGVAAENWPGAGAALGRIRQLVAVNLSLGLAVVVVAKLGMVFS
jgi:uncharacterized membrane protein